MDIKIKQTELEDVFELAPRLREADVRELKASLGSTPLKSLMRGFRISRKIYSVFLDGEVIIMFGVADNPFVKGEGVPWLLASDGMSKVTMRFLRESKEWLEDIKGDYTSLKNMVHLDNTLHLKWIKWLGFDFIRRIKIIDLEDNHNVFLEFEMKLK